MTVDYLVEEGLTDFQRSLQRALSSLSHLPSDMNDVARVRASLADVLALLNYERASAPVRATLPDEVDGRVVATRDGFDVVHLYLPRLRASVERPAVERIVRQHPQCMVVATSSDVLDEGAWHFINVKEAGPGRRVLRRAIVEPPFVGRTVLETLSGCQATGTDTALDIQIAHERAFDVEAVSKRFYIGYAQEFERLRDELVAIHDVSKERADEVVQELLNRLVFLMFIQRKGWLPTPENPDRNLLWTEFVQGHRGNTASHSYHEDFLHPLFVALSRPKDPHARRGLPPEVRQVPFLNGGLFDLDDDEEVLTLPNIAFERLFRNLLLRYNFTVREDTPLEVEVAIDPEMLGRVFENLILQLEKTGELDPRKASGSYYTPRPVVHFMCQQSLREWIAGLNIISAQALDTLFDLLQTERAGPEEREKLRTVMSDADAERLRDRLLDIAVVDPAVGSGAFLVGMLHEILGLVRMLDLVLVGLDAIDRRNYDYEIKQRIIQRCLYGVDIQRRAVRICELRLWLSLVVDYELTTGESPPSLPNLTYRVMAGDSLIEHLLGHEVRWAGEPRSDRERQLVDSIQAEKAAHFFKDDPQEKNALELSILRHTAELAREILSRRDRETQVQLGATVRTATTPDPLVRDIDSLMQRAERLSHGRTIRREDVVQLRAQIGDTFVWRLDFAEVHRDRNGFDIVIANPPYRSIAAGSLPGPLQSATNLFSAFMLLGAVLADRSGICVFIVPNTWQSGESYKPLREHALGAWRLVTLINLPYSVFGADVDNSIVVYCPNAARQPQPRFATAYFGKRERFTVAAQISERLRPVSVELVRRQPHARIPVDPYALDIWERVFREGANTVGTLTTGRRGQEAYAVDQRSRRDDDYTLRLLVGGVRQFALVEPEWKWIRTRDARNLPTSGPRMLVRRLVTRKNELVAAAVDETFAVKKDLYVLVSNQGGTDDGRFLVAVLNFPLTVYLCLARSAGSTQDNFRQVSFEQLRELPVPAAHKESIEAISGLVEELEQRPMNETIHEELLARLWKLYPVTDDERFYVMEWLAQKG